MVKYSHAELKAQILGLTPNDQTGSGRDRTRLVAAGNPAVLAEAADVDQPEPRLRSGPAWHQGLRARPVEHHPGKQDRMDIGRKKAVTY
jgi:hypothetical protein